MNEIDMDRINKAHDEDIALQDGQCPSDIRDCPELCKDCIPTSKTREELVKSLTNRFLTWVLPENFHPDCGISYTPILFNNEVIKPIGTNLFDYYQARKMIEYILEGIEEISNGYVY